MAVNAGVQPLAKMVGMTFVHLAADSNLVLSGFSVPPLPTLADLKALNPGDVGQRLIDNPWTTFGLTILGTLVAAVVVRWVLHRAIDRVVAGALTRAAGRESQTPRRASRVLAQATGLDEARKTQRAATMGAILKSTSTFVIATMVLLTVMATPPLSLPLGPLLASAGVGGVALGFGAQSLVKDFLSGVFMILEDQYGVGDAVNVGVASGTIEAVGLRVTRLRDVNGTVWYVRNGEILAVGNMSQSWSRVVLDIPVAFSTDLERVRTLLDETAHQLWQDPDFEEDILEEPEVWGVERWDPDGVVVRLVLKTARDRQGPVAREMRARIKASFDDEGIEIPLPQRMVWHRDDPGRSS